MIELVKPFTCVCLNHNFSEGSLSINCAMSIVDNKVCFRTKEMNTFKCTVSIIDVVSFPTKSDHDKLQLHVCLHREITRHWFITQ